MARKIRDQEDALACLEAWHASGAPLGVWSREHDIDGRSLRCWKLNTDWSPPGGGLVELVPPPRSSTGALYTLRVDGIEVEVGDDFCEDTLERILRVAAACARRRRFACSSLSSLWTCGVGTTLCRASCDDWASTPWTATCMCCSTADASWQRCCGTTGRVGVC